MYHKETYLGLFKGDQQKAWSKAVQCKASSERGTPHFFFGDSKF